MTTAADETGLMSDDDGPARCWWCAGDSLYQHYHDHEWGFPIFDEQRLFEKICLEGFQAGLSWLTILRKRDRFREVFAGFDPERLVRFTKRDVNHLLGDAGIIRHRGKIKSVINNAQRYLELREADLTLATLLWQHAPAPDERPRRISRATIPASTPGSTALSRLLKKRGWSFVGPTTLYATMQAVGVVNDHVEGCCVRKSADAARVKRDDALPCSDRTICIA